jgi:hypothetical protein
MRVCSGEHMQRQSISEEKEADNSFLDKNTKILDIWTVSKGYSCVHVV